MKQFLRFYNSLSILFKFLLPTVLALVFILFFFFYIAISSKKMNEDVTLVNNTLIPLFKTISKNELILEKIINDINSAVISKEIDWIDNTSIYKNQFIKNLDKSEIYKYQNQILQIKETFSKYYDLSTSVSYKFLREDLEFEYLYENSQNIVNQLNILKKQMNDFEVLLEKDIKENTNLLFSLTNSILLNSSYFFIFYILFSSLVIFSIYLKLKNRIDSIVLQSKEIAKGEANFHKRINIESTDELGVIIGSINDFIEKLDYKHKELIDIKNEIKQFIADTVHQIRTPLSNIMMNAEQIKKNQKNEQSSKYIDQINASINMLTNSYEDLSYITTYDSVEYHGSKISLSDLVNDRINFFETICKVNLKPINAEILSNINTYINHVECERIIDNNISNAIKYAKINKPISVVLSKSLDEKKVILEFKSFGKEIQDKVKIFNKNYRENDSKRGLGLGLNMVKNICEKYEIKYHVDYQENQNIFSYEFLID